MRRAIRMRRRDGRRPAHLAVAVASAPLLLIAVGIAPARAGVGPTLTIEPDFGAPGKTVTARGMGLNCNDPNDGVPNDGVPNDNVPNDNVPNDNVPNDNVPNDGIDITGVENAGVDRTGPLTVRWDNGVELAQRNTAFDGSFEVTLTVPQDATEGRHIVTAACTDTDSSATATFTVLLPQQPPTLTLTPDSGAPGLAVTADGARLNCNNGLDDVGSDGPLTVRWDDGHELATAATTSDGTFTETLNVPQDATEGPHTVTAACTDTDSSATATFTVLVPLEPTLTLTPASGQPETAVTADGSGLSCNVDAGMDGPLTLRWDDGRELARTQTTADGTFTAELTVPQVATDGRHTVTAACTDTDSSATATFTVIVQLPPPTLTLSALAGAPGTSVTGAGRGFDCNADSARRGGRVEVFWDDSSLTTLTADDTGGFTLDFIVPADAQTGSHQVTARCAEAEADQVAQADFEVGPGNADPPALQVSPSATETGKAIAVEGLRYPVECVTFALRLDGQVLPFDEPLISADPAGNTVTVTGTFTVPGSSPAGTYSVELECTTGDGEPLVFAASDLTLVSQSSSFPAVIAVVALLLVGIALAFLHAVRDARQKAWVRAHVRVEPRRVVAEMSTEELGTQRSYNVRLAAHFGTETQDVEEVAR
jgi:hypothetical protein